MHLALFSPSARAKPEPTDGEARQSTAQSLGLEKNLGRYIWNHTRYQQMWILVVVL
jgi:hypothetical protein